jgi:hypothetical protein
MQRDEFPANNVLGNSQTSGHKRAGGSSGTYRKKLLDTICWDREVADLQHLADKDPSWCKGRFCVCVFCALKHITMLYMLLRSPACLPLLGDYYMGKGNGQGGEGDRRDGDAGY